jgi:hypothetical protein
MALGLVILSKVFWQFAACFASSGIAHRGYCGAAQMDWQIANFLPLCEQMCSL